MLIFPWNLFWIARCCLCSINTPAPHKMIQAKATFWVFDFWFLTRKFINSACACSKKLVESMKQQLVMHRQSWWNHYHESSLMQSVSKVGGPATASDFTGWLICGFLRYTGFLSLRTPRAIRVLINCIPNVIFARPFLLRVVQTPGRV